MVDLMEFLWRRRQHLQSIFFLWITLQRISDACSTRGAPKPRSPPLAVPPPPAAGGVALPQHRGNNNNYTIPHLPCPSTYQKWYCLNGASCFTVKIGDTILYNCRCVVGYMGQRCEYKDTDESYGFLKARYMVRTASIAGGVSAAILIIIILIIAITIYVRRRRERKRGEEAPMSPEQLRRVPFGRALSRDHDGQFKVNRAFTPVDGGSRDLVAPSTSRGRHETAEQEEVLLGRLRLAPKASASDTTLSGTETNKDVLIAIPDGADEIRVHQSPYPYSSHPGGAKDPRSSARPLTSSSPFRPPKS